jgi:uncharacterized membrane protein
MPEHRDELNDAPGGESGQRRALSVVAKVWTTLVVALLVVWFLFAWLILDRQMLDAAGESVGTAFAVGIVVSLFAGLRGNR